MEKFLSLPADKQKVIIDAAIKCFGTNGYKKTSVSDIASAANISKAMVFHYFGTKKALYLYLIELCSNIIINEINDKFDYTVTDFFERIKLSASIKMSVVSEYAGIPDFLTSMYFENDDEVKDDINAIISKNEGLTNKIAFDGMDCSKFKDGIDPKLVFKMLLWLADGFAKELSDKKKIDYNVFCKEYYECMDLLRNNFYKEEYL